MKAILISDHAKWCALMMNGIKKSEVRKENVGKAVQKLIDENGYAEIYVCCTKGNEDIVRVSSPYSSVPDYACVKIDKKLSKDLPEYKYSSRGKVIFKFRCYKVEEISWQMGVYELEQQWFIDFLNKCCLGFCELKNYLNKKNGYAIHISDLEIFDEPKELSEFHRIVLVNKLEGYEKPLTKAPQSFCYVEVE